MVNISLTLKRLSLEELKNQANKERRSVNDFINIVLEDYIKREKN